MSVFEEILALYERKGAGAYFGECVSMTEHGLQAAHFARQAGAPPALIVAALLHDVGHLVEEVADDVFGWTRDAGHECVGARWLAQRFGADVAEPVRLHVPAKRYLLTTDPGYVAQLSPASVVTLKLQGGPMSDAELERFAAEPYREQAILVRRCDDRGKVADLGTPGLAEYAASIETLVLRQPR